jgi:hypothetical protein
MWDAAGAVDSVNGGMDRSQWPVNRLVTVRQFAEALAMYQGARRQRRTRAWSIDCEAFYRVVGRQRCELWRNGVWTRDGVQLDERCCFGDASAAVKCARISNFVVAAFRRAFREVDRLYPTRDEAWVEWQSARREAAAAAGEGEDAEAWADLTWIGQYIDDALGGGADDLLYSTTGVPLMREGVHVRRQEECFRAAREVLSQLGWASAASKEQPPCERVDALGVVVDLVSQRLWLGPTKRARYSAQASSVGTARVVQADLLREITHRLQFAAMCYPLGRQRLHTAHRALRATYRLSGGRVRVSRGLARDMEWWAGVLDDEEHEGVPLASVRDAFSDAEVGVMTPQARAASRLGPSSVMRC